MAVQTRKLDTAYRIILGSRWSRPPEWTCAARDASMDVAVRMEMPPRDAGRYC